MSHSSAPQPKGTETRLRRLVSRILRPNSGPGSGLDPNLGLVILFSLFTIGPLLQPGYQWEAHDARHSVYFLFELDRGIQDGILYPRWQPDFAFGYGYPFFNIYGPLSTYVGEVFHLLGFGFAASVKIVFALSVAGSGLAMYGFIKQVLGRQAGLVAAVAYMVIPYRLVDLYVRASLAESVAYTFVPLVLWGTWAALHRPRLANILGLAFAYAALLFTHPLTALLLTLILVFYVAALALTKLNDGQPWRALSRESFLPLVGHLGHILLPTAFALVLGLCISAIFSVPSVLENRYVRVDQWYGGRYAWGGDFVEFFQLFSPRWGFGASVPGPDDDFGLQLGVVPVVLSLFAAATLFRGRRSRSLRDSLPARGKPFGATHPTSTRLVIFFAALTAAVLFLMLGISAPLWQVLPLVRLAQFPWRLLSLTVVSMAILCGAAARGRSPEDRPRPVPTTLVLVALLIIGSLPYMQANMSQQEVSLAGLMRFQQSADEMTGSTAWVREIPRWSPMADFHIAGEPVTTRISFDYLYRQPGRPHARTLEFHVNSELVEYSAERPVLLTFNSFYYPGWHAYRVDPETNATIEELPISLRGELGLVTVRVPAGVGRVLLQFEDTPIRKLSTAVTLASLALAALLLLANLALWVRKARIG
jgi:hypothetical protein